MTRKTYQTWVTLLVSSGIAFGALAIARVDRRVDQAMAQSSRDTAQDVKIEEQAKQMKVVTEYMGWSTTMLVNIALRVGAPATPPPMMPMVNDLPTAPAAPRRTGKRR